MEYIKKQSIYSRKIDNNELIINNDGTIELTPAAGAVKVAGNLEVTGSSSGPTNDLVYYVSLEGDDANDGLGAGASRAKRSIKSAVEDAPAGSTIKVAPGEFYEDNPITLKERMTVRGDSLRNVLVFPNNPTLDLFLMDNACYLFQMTFRGLRDPGWCARIREGALVTTSPYVQNCTTFGYAAVGQKIDGALHDGGNDSIVSNDFTQVISDGIGAWLLNNGRAELVSVFSYYAHIGYLCETGGRARATNGNNSYGTYGSVAEGVDPDETPVTAVVDNSTQYNATISNVYTNTDAIQRLEYSHAGNDYTEAQVDIFGVGDSESLVQDEFRDEGVNQVRIIEVDDSTGNPDATAGATGPTDRRPSGDAEGTGHTPEWSA